MTEATPVEIEAEAAQAVSVGRRHSPLLDALRAQTGPAHESLHATVDEARLSEAAYYAAVVSGLLSAAEGVEAILAATPDARFPDGLGRAAVSKQAAIESERAFLASLTVGSSAVELPAPSTPPELQVPSDRAELLGVLYVYVGAGLGGLHLLRIVQPTSWWASDRSPVLFRPYGHDLHERWRTLLDALGGADASKSSAVVEAALAVFASHHECVRQALAGR